MVELQMFDPEKAKENDCRENIGFYMTHLSLTELKVLETLAHSLAEKYSESYRDWRINQNK